MTVVGVDLALRHTGLAAVDYETGQLVDRLLLSTSPLDDLGYRLHHLAAAVAEFAADAADVWVEQPIAYRSGTTTLHLGMAHGAVLARLHPRTVGTVNPARLKRWAAQRGGASKADMIDAAHSLFGVWLDHNVADAALVAAYGREQIIAAVEAE